MNTMMTPAQELATELCRLRGESSAAEAHIKLAAESTQGPRQPWVAKLLGAIAELNVQVDSALASLAAKSSRGASRHLLVVDDQPSTLAILRKLLEDNGFVVSTVDTVAGATARLDAEQFHALVTDIHLPDGNGIELLRQSVAWQASGGGRLPVVVISGDHDPTVVAELQRHEGAWVPKSKLAPDLVDQILRQIARFAPPEPVLQDVVGAQTLAGIQSIGTREEQRNHVDQAFKDASDRLRGMKEARDLGKPNEWKVQGNALHGIVVMLGATRLTPLMGPILQEKDEAQIARAIAAPDLHRTIKDEVTRLHAFYRSIYVDLRPQFP
jgi:CheY-like chemotaxis protein